MSTQTVVDEIKLKAPAWSRDGSTAILQVLDRCQKTLFSKPCNPTIYIDPTTGQHPFLTTVDSQYAYELPDITMTLDDIPRPIRMAKAIELYTPNGELTEYTELMVDPTRQASGIYSQVFSDRMVVRCTTLGATEATNAKIIFPFNPGATTNRYMYKALIEPLRLTEDTIPLMVEEIWEPDLINGVLGWIEYADYGRSDRWAVFSNESCQRFWNQGNEGDHQGKVYATPPRFF